MDSAGGAKQHHQQQLSHPGVSEAAAGSGPRVSAVWARPLLKARSRRVVVPPAAVLKAGLLRAASGLMVASAPR